MRTLEQKRAEFALEKVRGQNKDYCNLVKSAPAMVMNNGLMQTLAFLKAKKKGHHITLLNHITEWLKRMKILKKSSFEGVMDELFKKSSMEYQRATDETLAILRWLRHLADAVIAKPELE